MESRLYRGHVLHKRSSVAENHFRYGVYYVFVDIDRLDELDASLSRFGHNRRALVSVWDRDHGPRDGSALRPWIDALCAEAGIDMAGGRVFLLTFPRVMGFRFFPVSFWYCYDASGSPVAVLAEVQNTFRDHHNYLLHNGGAPYDWHAMPEATKAFYVSPFIRVPDMRYRFHFSEPGERLSASIYDFALADEAARGLPEVEYRDRDARVGGASEGELILTASISLDALPLTDDNLRAAVLALGPISARALVLIHWQALKLLVKRVPFFAHTPPPTKETSR